MDSQESGRSVRLVASDGDAGANPEDRMQECLAGAARVQWWPVFAERDQALDPTARAAGDRGEISLAARRSGKHRRNLTKFEAGGSR
jgi:hypothetical protein